jgi:hypothetical protein
MTKKILIKSIVPGLIGALLFVSFSLWLFRVNLLTGFVELWHMQGPLFFWGTLIGLSVIVGCWSVGGAFLYLCKLSWRRARLYSPDDK